MGKASRRKRELRKAHLPKELAKETSKQIPSGPLSDKAVNPIPQAVQQVRSSRSKVLRWVLQALRR